MSISRGRQGLTYCECHDGQDGGVGGRLGEYCPQPAHDAAQFPGVLVPDVPVQLERHRWKFINRPRANKAVPGSRITAQSFEGRLERHEQKGNE